MSVFYKKKQQQFRSTMEKKQILECHKRNMNMLPLYYFSYLTRYLEINYNIWTWYMLNLRQLVPDVFGIRLNDGSIYSAPRICDTSGNYKSDTSDIYINIHGHLQFVNQTEYFLVFIVNAIFLCIPRDAGFWA